MTPQQTLAAATIAALVAGCHCGVEEHPHCHVVREIHDPDLLLECLYFPDFDPVRIGEQPWFRNPFPWGPAAPPCDCR